MYLKPCKFHCKEDVIKGKLKRLKYKNWWESMFNIDNKNARTKLKRESQKEANKELLEYKIK